MPSRQISLDSLKNESIVILEQVIVAIPRLRRGNMLNRSELVEYTRWRLGPIVEEEHDPRINDQTMLSSQDNCSLVVWIVICEVAQGCQHLWCFVWGEDIVPAPDFVVLRMRLHGVGSDDAEVVTSSFQRGEEVLDTLVSMLLVETVSLTWVLLLVGIYRSSIGQYNLKVDDIVGCPAVLGTQETHATCWSA